jgi:hypothetical protein
MSVPRKHLTGKDVPHNILKRDCDNPRHGLGCTCYNKEKPVNWEKELKKANEEREEGRRLYGMNARKGGTQGAIRKDRKTSTTAVRAR